MVRLVQLSIMMRRLTFLFICNIFSLPELVNDQRAEIRRHLREHPVAADSAQMPNATIQSGLQF